MNIIVYKFIGGFPGYIVGSDGSVWSNHIKGGRGGRSSKWKRLKPNRDPNGYEFVLLRNKNEKTKKQIRIHRLVLESFYGKPSKEFEGSHLNGNKSDNRLCNLIWESKHDNNKRKTLHGTNCRQNHPSAKLQNNDVINIRKLWFNEKRTQRSIAKMYSVSYSTICNILKGKSWSSL